MIGRLQADWSLRPVPTSWIIAGGVAAVAVGAAGSAIAGRSLPLLAMMGLLALAGVAYLMVWTRLSTLVSLAIAASIFSGNSSRLGFPIGPDRILFLGAIGSLVVGLPGAVRERRVILRPIHAVLAAAGAYATLSAFAAGTLRTSSGFFGLLDRFGLVPMLMFSLAPVIFGTPRARRTLLLVLVVVGAYLSVTAFAEELNVTAMIFPKYILNSSVGIHFGRARGPFVDAVADGLALYACAVACGLAVVEWTSRRARGIALVIGLACLGGTALTLTRAVWLASIIATVLALLVSPQTRRLLPPLMFGGAALLLLGLALLPNFANRAEERTNDNGPVWERYATDAAAIRAIKRHPLVGVGWDKWLDVSREYLRKGRNYPLTRTVGTIQIHNVPLSHAAELGLIGATLWLVGLGSAVAAAILRRGPPDLDPWRVAFIAILVNWAVVANFGPLSNAFANLLLWTWAGICSIGHLSVPATADDAHYLRA